MNKIVAVMLLLTMMAWTGWSQATYQRKVLCTVRNVTVAGSGFAFEIWAKNDSAGTNFFVGDADFYFTYNSSALVNPAISNINPKYTGNAGVDNYDPMQVATIGGRVQVGIRYSGAAGGSSVLSGADPYGELICQVNLSIVDGSQSSQLEWDVVNSSVLTNGSFAVLQTFQGSDNSPLPVQLAGFSGSVINAAGHVLLRWRTLSETNNYGFYVQKSDTRQGNFLDASALIPGHGTTTEPHEYSWTDVNAAAGTWYYRLRQVDLDGMEHFSESVRPGAFTEVAEQPLPKDFSLSQNYPNPFNPTTRIAFALPRQSSVDLELYNLLGQKVATLLQGAMPAGYHGVEFNATGFSSGLYFYRLTVEGNRTFMKKMVVLK